MQRVILGGRGSDNGLWISKPGRDAASTNDDDMMVSPSRYLLQPYMQGRIYSDGTQKVGVIVNHNLGFIPAVELFSPSAVPPECKVSTSTLDFSQTQYNSSSTTYSSTDNTLYVQFQGGGQTEIYAFDVTYFIFRQMLSAN